MNKKLKTYLKTLMYSKVLFDYLQMQDNGIEELIDKPITGKMDAMEKRYLGINYFIYKFAEQSGVINKDILWGIDSFYYRYSKAYYISYQEMENTDVAEIIADAENVLKLVFEGGEND